jgi:hypothetical protein
MKQKTKSIVCPKCMRKACYARIKSKDFVCIACGHVFELKKKGA